MKVLICDDEENIRNLMKRFLALEGVEADTAENGLSAERMLRASVYDAALLDLKMPGLDGLGLLKWIRQEGFRMPVIMISAHGDVTDAVEALKNGADDYIVKPFDPEEVVIKLKSLVDAASLKSIVEGSAAGGSFIGESMAMQDIRRIIQKIAPTAATVLITGESGTGKEVVAREIHKCSSVKDGPFIAINIGGVPENLLESELFLFLDEIGDMPLSLQVKILRVLQEKKITRLGGTEPMPINARIIAATNKNLEKMVGEGRFREDLFYRLNVVRIHIPPLRERRSDIPVLAAYIIARYGKEMGLHITGFTPEALEMLKNHDFYGNVRELENIIERAMIFADSELIGTGDLDLRSSLQRKTAPSLVPDVEALSLRDMERNAIIRALQRWEGNRTRAADELGISRRTLINKIQEYGIGKDS